MSIKLPFKKHNIVLIFGFGIILVIISILVYLNINASTNFAERKAQHRTMVNSQNQTAHLLVRLKECAQQQNSDKFKAIHSELVVKSFKDPHSIDAIDIEPALIECKRLAYQ